jgi:hypothetical protein
MPKARCVSPAGLSQETENKTRRDLASGRGDLNLPASSWHGQVQTATTNATGLAYDFFRFLRRPLGEPPMQWRAARLYTVTPGFARPLRGQSTELKPPVCKLVRDGACVWTVFEAETPRHGELASAPGSVPSHARSARRHRRSAANARCSARACAQPAPGSPCASHHSHRLARAVPPIG